MDLRLMTENATHNLTAVGKSIKLEINAWWEKVLVQVVNSSLGISQHRRLLKNQYSKNVTLKQVDKIQVH